MKKMVIIDIGSNSIRLILVRLGEKGNFKIIHDLKEAVGLEKDLEQGNTIKPDRINKALRTLVMFRRHCEAVQPDEVMVVATEAVRRAANRELFAERVREETGFEIRVLSGPEEAFYGYVGVTSSMDIADALLMDLGGGSTELTWMAGGQVQESVSLPLGALNVTQQFDLADDIKDEQMRRAQAEIAAVFSGIPWLSGLPPKRLIGIGGTFRNLCKIDRRRKSYPLERTHNYLMTPQDIMDIHKEVSSRNLKQRRTVKGLSSERWDNIVGATTVITELLQYAAIDEVVISGHGLREGLVYDYIARTLNLPGDVLEKSLLKNLNNYNLDVTHARTVYRIASSLYRQLQGLKKIDGGYDKVLKAAAMMHDVGTALNFYQQNEHLFYMLVNSELHGLTHRELVMSAYAACNQFNSKRQYAGVRFRSFLTDKDEEVLKGIGLLIRIARSLDRSMCGLIEDVICAVERDKVIIKTITEGDIELEILDALRYCDDFKKYFRKSLFIM
ncbi:MAG: Ppx/GppA phosphatase family protein [Syntrophomonadaceae bacterium]